MARWDPKGRYETVLDPAAPDISIEATLVSSPAGDPVAELESLLGQLSNPGPGEASGQPDTADSESPDPVYPDVGAFVNGYLAHVVERQIAKGAQAGVYWCAKWWAHPEALSRLYALWRAWETLRVSDPNTGMSIWWRDHLDPHLGALTAGYGPFTRCSPDRHYDPAPLPVQPVPAEILAVLPDAQQ